MVEDEAVTVEMAATGFLEIFQDATVQLQHMRQSRIPHQQCGFLAADAAGAIADDRLALELAAARLQRLRKLTEAREALTPTLEPTGPVR